MLNPEARFRRNIVKKLRRWHAISVENGVRAGTPDVNWAGGWLELKYLRSWPALPETPVALHRFSPQQRTFLRARWAAGGAAYLLVNVAGTLYLFRGCDVNPIGNLPSRQFKAASVWMASESVSGALLMEALRTHAPKGVHQ